MPTYPALSLDDTIFRWWHSIMKFLREGDWHGVLVSGTPSQGLAWSTQRPIPHLMCLVRGSLIHAYRSIYMTTTVQEGALSLLLSFDRLLSGSHLLNYSPCPSSAGNKEIYHKDLPISHSASNPSVVSVALQKRNVKLSKWVTSFLCPSIYQALHLFYSNLSLPEMLW